MKDLLFSIITVSYNCKELVSCTVQSVLKQKYHLYEYIIIDGGSTDGTLEEIKKLSCNVDIKLKSELDNGIYDAMNKGLELAVGKYVCFLNMGDWFVNDKVLEEIAERVKGGKDIYYGNVIYGNNLRISPNKISFWLFLNEKMICHQAIFAKKECFVKNIFKTKFLYCSDRHWMYICYKQKRSFEHMNITVVYYDTNGVSSQAQSFLDDSMAVIQEDFGVSGIIYVLIKRSIGKIIRKVIAP